MTINGGYYKSPSKDAAMMPLRAARVQAALIAGELLAACMKLGELGVPSDIAERRVTPERDRQWLDATEETLVATLAQANGLPALITAAQAGLAQVRHDVEAAAGQ